MSELEERYQKLLTDLLDVAQQVDAQLQQIINTIKRDLHSQHTIETEPVPYWTEERPRCGYCRTFHPAGRHTKTPPNLDEYFKSRGG